MMVELELAGVLALLAVPYLRRRTRPAVAPAAAGASAAAPATAPGDGFEVLRKHESGGWLHVGFRHAAHGDYHEALTTPGLAVRLADGTILEGVSHHGV